MAAIRCSVHSLTILCIILALAQVTAHAPTVKRLFILRLVRSETFYMLNVTYQTDFIILHHIQIITWAHFFIILFDNCRPILNLVI